jgi:hypothetical protein
LHHYGHQVYKSDRQAAGQLPPATHSLTSVVLLLPKPAGAETRSCPAYAPIAPLDQASTDHYLRRRWGDVKLRGKNWRRRDHGSII